jgi:hypothetical protein
MIGMMAFQIDQIAAIRASRGWRLIKRNWEHHLTASAGQLTALGAHQSRLPRKRLPVLSPKFRPDNSFRIFHENYNAARQWCDVQKIGHDAYYQAIERYETREGRMPKVRRLAYLL